MEGEDTDKRDHTLAGSYCYMSPEMLRHQIPCFGNDLWALGCIVYFMLTGKHLFNCGSKFELEDRVLNCDYELPKSINSDAKDLIDKLLVLDPRDRIGFNDYDEIKAHSFFKGKDFERIHKQIPPVHSMKGGYNFKKYVRKFDNLFEEDPDVRFSLQINPTL